MRTLRETYIDIIYMRSRKWQDLLSKLGIWGQCGRTEREGRARRGAEKNVELNKNKKTQKLPVKWQLGQDTPSLLVSTEEDAWMKINPLQCTVKFKLMIPKAQATNDQLAALKDGKECVISFRYLDQPHAKTCLEIHRNIAYFGFKTKKVYH